MFLCFVCLDCVTFVCLSNILVAPKITYDAKYKQPQQIKTGTTILIQVNIAGMPTPTVQWFLGEKPVEPSKDITIETDDTSSRITIKGAKTDDAGKYKVTAENNAGSDSAEFDVIVKGNSNILLLMTFCNLALQSFNYLIFISKILFIQ